MPLPPNQIMHAHLPTGKWAGLLIGAGLGSLAILAILAGLANAVAYLRGGPKLEKVAGGPRGALSSAILGILVGSYFVWVSMIFILPRVSKSAVQAQKDDLKSYLSAYLPDTPPELFLQYVRVGAIGIDDDIDGGPALVNYLSVGNTAAAQQLLAAGASLENHVPDEKPPLLTAVGDDELEVVHFLLAAHANPDAAENSTSGNTPIFDAVNPDSDPIPATHTTSSHPDDGDNTPPINFTSHHRREITQALVSAGVHLNVRDDRTYTPLIVAAATGQCDLVATLLPGHPDLSLRDKDGFTALDWAKQDHPECAPLLHGTPGSAAAAANLLARLPPVPDTTIPDRIRQNREARTNVEQARAQQLADAKAQDRQLRPLGPFTGIAGQLFWSLILSTVLYAFHRIRSFLRGDKQPVHWSWVPRSTSSSSSYGADSDSSSSSSTSPSRGGSSGGGGASGDF